MAGRPIDEKIVAMKMDNSDFKRKAVETTGLFGKLQSALSRTPNLDLSKTTQAFGDIQKAANNTDLSGLARSADTIASRFSNLGVVATTALMNITNRAVDAGLQLARSVTVAPVMDGFREYELKMGSIQTMLSNTEWEHTTLDDVKATLQELNAYADQTIYDFGQMTSSIGKWTAAGVGLKDSAIAIKGMGNLAAVSGASVDQLNTAMYQMSQGMAAGKFGAIDWISMTNAGMGGKKTQDALMATAKAMGHNIDLSNGFKGSLEQGWLTADVFLKTMQQFGNDKSMTEAATSVRTFTGMIAALKEGVGSGWAETWELIFGDFEVATKRWTGLSKAIGGFFDRSTKSRNKFVGSLADAGVFQTIFDGVTNSLNGILLVFDAIGKGFKMAFPPVGLDTVKGFAAGFRDFFGALSPSRETFQKIASISQAFFEVLKSGGAVIAYFAKSLWNMIPPNLVPSVMSLLEHVGKMVIAFATSESTLNAIKSVFSTVSLVVRTIVSEIVELGKAIADMIPPDLANNVGGFFKSIADAVTTFATSESTINAITSTIKGIFTVVKLAIGGLFLLGSALFNLIPGFDNSSASGDKFQSTMGNVGNGFAGLGNILNGISEGFSNLGGAINQASSILSNGVFTGKGPWEKDSAIVDWLFKIRAGFQSMGKSLGSIKISLDPITNAFKAFFGVIRDGFDWVKEKLSGIGESIKNALPDGTKLFAGGFVAAMIAVVGVVLKTWWDLKEALMGWGKIGNGLSEVLESTAGALDGFAWQMRANAISTTLIAVGIALAFIAGSLWAMSKIPSDKVAGVLTALTTALAGLIGGMAILTKYDITGTGMKAALQMIAMGIALTFMAGALKKLSDLEWNEIGKGITALSGIMLALSGALILISKFGGAKTGASALQILAIAGAMHILVSAVKKIAEIDPEVLKKGTIWMGAILLELGLFFALAGRTKFGIGATLGMLAVGKAIMNIVDAIKSINEIDPKDLKEGLSTIAQILTAITIFAAITGYTGLFAAGAGMLLVAAALTALIIPISALGSMNMDTLTKGLGSIAITLVAIGAASLMMMKTNMLAAGAGIILIAIAMGMLLPVITLFGQMSWGTIIKGVVGFALALGLIGGVAALLGLAATPMMMFGAAIGIIGIAMLAAGAGMSLFATGLVTLSTMTAASVTAIVATLGTLIAGLMSLIPLAVEFVVDLFVKMMEAIAKAIPKLIDIFAKMMVSIADTLEKNPRFLDACVQLMNQMTIIFIKGGAAVVKALFGAIPGVSKAVDKMASSAEEKLRANMDARGVGEKKGKDFAEGLGSKTGAAQSAGNEIANAGKLGSNIPNFTKPGTEQGADFVSGLASKTGSSETAGTQLANAGKTGVNAPNFKTPGTEQGTDFVSGLVSKTGSSETAGTKLANAGKQGAESVDMESTGSHFGSGFASGISGAYNSVVNAAKNLAIAAKKKVESFLDINSPSRVMRTTGGWFGEGFALGISDQTSQVGDNAKGLAITAKDSLNQFLDGFELPEPDRELRFKAVVDYDKLDVNRFGNPSLSLAPNTSLTSSMIPAIASTVSANDVSSQNANNTAMLTKLEEQLGIAQKQVELLAGILNKDNSTYIDGKEMYNSVKKVQDTQTTIRNIFKGVSRV